MKNYILIFLLAFGVTAMALDFSLPNPAVAGQTAVANKVNENWLKPLNILSSYDGQYIKDNSISGDKLQGGTIDGSKINDGSLAPVKLDYSGSAGFTFAGQVNFVPDEIESADINDGTIVAGNIANNTITGNNLNETDVVTKLVNKESIIYYYDIPLVWNDSYDFHVYHDNAIGTKLIIIELMRYDFNILINPIDLVIRIADATTSVEAVLVSAAQGAGGADAGYNIATTRDGANTFIMDVTALQGPCSLTYTFNTPPVGTIFSMTGEIDVMKKINIYERHRTGE